MPEILVDLYRPLDLFYKFSTLLMVVFGALFIAIWLRVRLDRGILYFGLFLLCISAIVGVDVWIFPEPGFAESHHLWIRLQHMLACALILGMNLYGLWVNRIEAKAYAAAAWIGSVAVAFLFATTDMVKPTADGVDYTPIYLYIFAPYFAVFVVVLDGIMIRGLFRGPEEEMGIIRFQVFGMFVLAVCAVMDLLRNLDPDLALVYSATSFGSLIYGLTGAAVFLERVVRVIRDRQEFQENLLSASHRLAEAREQASLGRSAALVNHEIRNYLATIRGNAVLLRGSASGAGDKPEIGRIVRSIERIDDLTRDISGLEQWDLKREGRAIELGEFLRDLLRFRFPEAAGTIILEGDDQGIVILGDRKRLEQAFYNILKNAFEAGAREIRIRLERRPNEVAVLISDDGTGCPPELVDRLATPFYTTKTAVGGTGLGLSFSRMVCESHAGSLEFQSHAAAGPAKGMTVIATFPVQGAMSADLTGIDEALQPSLSLPGSPARHGPAAPPPP